MYLVAVIDWYSRYIVSWALDEVLELPFVLHAVDMALEKATPLIWNSDQGSHFTSVPYLSRLEGAGIQISMDSKGRALDNIVIERFWRTIKYEDVYLNDYATPRATRRGISTYLERYNHIRLHETLRYHTPAAVYHGVVQLPDVEAPSGAKALQPI